MGNVKSVTPKNYLERKKQLLSSVTKKVDTGTDVGAVLRGNSIPRDSLPIAREIELYSNKHYLLLTLEKEVQEAIEDNSLTNTSKKSEREETSMSKTYGTMHSKRQPKKSLHSESPK